MTNREHYKEFFENHFYDFVNSTDSLAVKDGIPYICEGGTDEDIHACDGCDFQGTGNCMTHVYEWLNAEYQEVDWSKVDVDTGLLVSNDNSNWTPAYFAYYKFGKVFVWADGKTSFTSPGEEYKCEAYIYAKIAL